MKNRNIVCILILVYAVMFLVFYPPFHTTLDENNFLRLSHFLMEGRILIENPQHQLGFGWMNGAYRPYFIGQSVLMIPFVLFGWNAVFILGMILHIIAALVFYKIVVEKQNRNPLYTALFLFFPYLVYYSATIFSDFSSAVFIFLAFWFYMKKDRSQNTISGVLFGFACVIKYTNLLAFIPFFLYTLWKDREKLTCLLTGIAPFAVFILCYNTWAFGGPLETLHSTAEFIGVGSSMSSFTPANWLVYLPFIIFKLVIIYPFMFFAPFFYKRRGRWEILGVYVLFLLFYGARYQSGYGFGFVPSTLIRYMVPVIPLMLITYPDFVENILKRASGVFKPAGKLFRPLGILVVIGLIAGSGLILSGQHQYLSQQRSVCEKIYEITPEGSLIIAEQDMMRYIMEPFGERRFLDTQRYEDFSPYLDDKTYIVYKKYQEGSISGLFLKWSLKVEGVIERMNTTLVEETEYPPIKGFMSSRPFKLQVYKVCP